MSATADSALLAGLVDDAGLFPPTALTMPEAVARHRADQQAGAPMLTHRFLCPAGRLDELRTELVETDRFRIGLITDRGVEGLDEVLAVIEADPRLSLALLEVPLVKFDSSVAVALRALDGVSASVPVFLEPPGAGEIDRLLAEVNATSGSDRCLGAKLRCGGVRAELFPSPDQVAHFLTTCVAAGTPLKATAGLHQAVRHTDPGTGFTHHGYLNLLLGAAVATTGAREEQVRSALEITEADELGERIAALSPETVAFLRQVLVSYGSCSTSTPIAQARAILGNDDGEDSK